MRPHNTQTIDTAELILALCEAGEWELAVKFAKEKAAQQGTAQKPG